MRIKEGTAGLVSAPEPGGLPRESSHDLEAGTPFFDVLPADAATGQLNVAFELPEQPMMLGIEGAIGFIRSLAPDGILQVDTIISFEGHTLDVPVGEQTLVVYYRTCDGNCASLDTPIDFCVVDAQIEDGAQFDLTVKIVNAGRAVCELAPTG